MIGGIDMEYTVEKIYEKVGKYDYTAGLTFAVNSESANFYGPFLTVQFIYTQREREELDRKTVEGTGGHGYAKAKILGIDLDEGQVRAALDTGILSSDIVEILYYKPPTNNTFHSKEKRTIEKIEVPVQMMPKGGDLNWMYGFKKKMIADGHGLTPRERTFYLAAKLYYEPDNLTEEEQAEIYFEGKINEDIEFEYLGLKYVREDISDEEKIRAAELLGKNKRDTLLVLNEYLVEAGSSLNKLSETNIEQAAYLYNKVLYFKRERLNPLGKKAIYIDVDRYLHIYMRHVEEYKVNSHFEHKDNFQWKEDDVYVVMEHVIKALNSEIQEFMDRNPDKWYRRYGNESCYFEGDYYSLHIEPSGRVSTFYKNKKDI